MKLPFEWFVAGRYLHEARRRSGWIPLLVAGAMLVAAVVFFWKAAHTPPPGPAEVIRGDPNWKEIHSLNGIAASIGAVLFGVFGGFRRLLSIFTTISAFGVFLGTAALVIVLSVMNGFEEDLRAKILGASAHVLVTKEAKGFTEWREVGAKLDGIPGIVGHAPYVSSEVVVATTTDYRGVIIKGIDPKLVGQVTDLARNLEPGSKLEDLWPAGTEAETETEAEAEPEAETGAEPEPEDFSQGPEPVEEEPEDFSGENVLAVPIHPMELGERARRRDPRIAALDGVIVGRELAKGLHLYTDEEVQMVSSLLVDTPGGQVPRTKPFRVAGKFYSGMYEYDDKVVYVTLPALQSFLMMGDEVDGIEIKVADAEETGPVVRAIAARLGPAYTVRDWKAQNASLFTALKLEKIVMFVVLAIIILVASLSIVSNLIMVVVEKGREIAILKSIGASDASVMRVFMIEGLLLGLLGTAFGITCGVLACWALERFGVPLDANVYYIDRLPVAMDPVAITAVALAGVMLSFVATVYPSYVASRLRPVEGLRYD